MHRMYEWIEYAILNDTNFNFTEYGLKDAILMNKINLGEVATFDCHMSAFRDRSGNFITFHGRNDPASPSLSHRLSILRSHLAHAPHALPRNALPPLPYSGHGSLRLRSRCHTLRVGVHPPPLFSLVSITMDGTLTWQLSGSSSGPQTRSARARIISGLRSWTGSRAVLHLTRLSRRRTMRQRVRIVGLERSVWNVGKRKFKCEV
jgi:hypothetical protein